MEKEAGQPGRIRAVPGALEGDLEVIDRLVGPLEEDGVVLLANGQPCQHPPFAAATLRRAPDPIGQDSGG